jgi:hypothetical protein
LPSNILTQRRKGAEDVVLLPNFAFSSCFFYFLTKKNMKEEHAFLITYGSLRPLRALRDDFSYVFLNIPLTFHCCKFYLIRFYARIMGGGFYAEEGSCVFGRRL